MNLFKRKPKPNPVKEKTMNYFSVEYRDTLVHEHKLVASAINQLTEKYKMYAPHHGADAMTAALTSLRGKKVELEAKIDVLDEFLDIPRTK